jgi:soluble lytic murein transglycosylase-like protein
MIVNWRCMKIFKLILHILIILAILHIADAYAINCVEHPIYCTILENRPKIDRDYAMKLSNIIHKVTVKYNIPALIYTAILMQESGYKQDAKGCVRGLDVDFNEKVVCSDFGISQINYRTAKRFGFDIEKIIKDLEYAIDCGAIVLYNFKKRYSKREEYYWTRYNSSTKVKRLLYKKLVLRYMPNKEE